jgi:hypothetical protein
VEYDAPSRLHWKVAVASASVKVNVAVEDVVELPEIPIEVVSCGAGGGEIVHE